MLVTVACLTAADHTTAVISIGLNFKMREDKTVVSSTQKALKFQGLIL